MLRHTTSLAPALYLHSHLSTPNSPLNSHCPQRNGANLHTEKATERQIAKVKPSQSSVRVRTCVCVCMCFCVSQFFPPASFITLKHPHAAVIRIHFECDKFKAYSFECGSLQHSTAPGACAARSGRLRAGSDRRWFIGWKISLNYLPAIAPALLPAKPSPGSVCLYVCLPPFSPHSKDPSQKWSCFCFFFFCFHPVQLGSQLCPSATSATSCVHYEIDAWSFIENTLFANKTN